MILRREKEVDRRKNEEWEMIEWCKGKIESGNEVRLWVERMLWEKRDRR